MRNLADVYTGTTAETYQQEREVTDIWQREQEVIAPVLMAGLRRGSRVLDVASGTGRWLATYAAAGARPVLLDVSADMLRLAQTQAQATGMEVEVIQGDVFGMASLPPSDWMVCTRFFNWIRMREIRTLLGKARCDGIHTIAFTVRCLDADASREARLASWSAWQEKNLQVLAGARKKGIYHLHSASRLRHAASDAGLRIVMQSPIERTPGDVYALYVMTAATDAPVTP